MRKLNIDLKLINLNQYYKNLGIKDLQYWIIDEEQYDINNNLRPKL